MSLSIIMPFSGPDYFEERWGNYMWLRDRYDALLPDNEIVIGFNEDEPFNRAAARNSAMRASTGDLLLFADADTVFHPEQIYAAIDLIDNGAPWVVAYGLGRYYNLSEKASKDVRASAAGAVIPEPTDPNDWEHKIDSWAGLLVVPRAACQGVGGYDERFIGWGYEDNAFRSALDHHVGVHQRVDHYALHLWHPSSEQECFAQPHIDRNRELCRQYEQGLLP